jgi:hypothetical protein
LSPRDLEKGLTAGAGTSATAARVGQRGLKHRIFLLVLRPADSWGCALDAAGQLMRADLKKR